MYKNTVYNTKYIIKYNATFMNLCTWQITVTIQNYKYMLNIKNYIS